MQVNDNLIRNADRSNMTVLIDKTVKRGDNAVEEFKSGMQLRIEENDKKLTIEKKPVEKTKQNPNPKSADNRDKKSYKVDDATYSKAAGSLNTNNSSNMKVDNTVYDDETRVLAANTILNTDNLVKNMLLGSATEGFPIENPVKDMNIADEKPDGFVEGSLIEEFAGSDIKENKNQLEETAGKDEVINLRNADSGKAVLQNAHKNPDEITANVEVNNGLLKETEKVLNENTEDDRTAQPNNDNALNFEIKSDETPRQYEFESGSDEKNLSEKKEKVEFDFTDKIAGDNNHKNIKSVMEDISAAEMTDGLSEDNELRIKIIEQIADHMEAYAVAKKDTLELMLNPENLGKLMMQVKQTSSGVAISILCETQKTYHLLKERSGEIAAILDKKLQDPVTVNVQHESKQDYLHQNNRDNSKDAFYEQQSRQQEERQNRQMANETTSFLSRLRLGIN